MGPTLTLEYYGLSSFSIRVDDAHLLVDPWIDEPEWSTRTVEDFLEVDYVLVTHGAHDHLGETLPIAERSGARVITEPAVADHLIDAGLPADQVTRLIWGNVLREDRFTVRALETRHLSFFESTTGTLSGLPLGFCFEFEDLSVYYLGDTAIFSDLKLFGELYEPDVAIVPIENAPEALAPLPPREAAIATDWLSVETVIPVHYVPGSDAPTRFGEHLREVAAPDELPSVVTLDVDERVSLSTFASE